MSPFRPQAAHATDSGSSDPGWRDLVHFTSVMGTPQHAARPDGLMAFFFNATVLAWAINTATSLL